MKRTRSITHLYSIHFRKLKNIWINKRDWEGGSEGDLKMFENLNFT